MQDHFDTTKQPKEEFGKKMDWCYQLKNIISKNNPTWLFNIVPTGSTVTGLATKNSDLDVAIHIPQAARVLEQEERGRNITDDERQASWREIQLEILQIVRLNLQNDEQINSRINWEHGIQLVQAQIQILKVMTVDGIDCDISVVMDRFLSSMHNSFLIRHLAHIDGRFAPLCAIVKQWAASTKVKDPKDGGFNSYALVLLVIHFLQCGTFPPILPNLQEIFKKDNFIAWDDKVYPSILNFGAPLPKPLPRIAPNNAPLARLFIEFLYYYSMFNFKENYIGARPVMVMDRRTSQNNMVRSSTNKEVCIQDPFDEHNPGRTVRTLNRIKDVMRSTYQKFLPVEGSEFTFPTLDDIINMSPEVPKPSRAEVRNFRAEATEVNRVGLGVYCRNSFV